MQTRKGFTLIELLVVIAIMTTVLTLVAPLMISQVDKTKAAAEFAEAEQYINDSAKVAFLRGQSIQFVFEGKQLTRRIGSEEIVLSFEYIFFPLQTLHFNANGFTATKSIEIKTLNRTEHLALKG